MPGAEQTVPPVAAVPPPEYRIYDLYAAHCASAHGYREGITHKLRYRCRHPVSIESLPRG